MRLFSILWLLLLPTLSLAGGSYELPPLPPAFEYGSALMNRVASQNNAQPVIFSHWVHRTIATCRICHGELGFEMSPGATAVTAAEIRAGRYCGACHDGNVSFGTVSNCQRCHTGDLAADRQKFELFNKKPFPTTDYGNGIDWVRAFRRGMIEPAGYIYTPGSAMVSDKIVTFEAKIARIAPAIFPHAPHGEWMDCNTCHPDLFNIQEKSTKKITKSAILKGEYCGVCHLRIAFPMNDCPRCHPGMHSSPQ